MWEVCSTFCQQYSNIDNKIEQDEHKYINNIDVDNKDENNVDDYDIKKYYYNL